MKTLLEQTKDLLPEPEPTLVNKIKCLVWSHDFEYHPDGYGHVVRCIRCGKQDWAFIP